MNNWLKALAALAAAVVGSAAMAGGGDGPAIESFAVAPSSAFWTLCFPAEEGSTYMLQRTPDSPAEGDGWAVVDLLQADTDDIMELADRSPRPWPRAFYRIAAIPGDATPDASQISLSAMAAACKDYKDAIQTLSGLSDDRYDMFLSGELGVSNPYHYSSLSYDRTDFWMEVAANVWLPESVRQNTGIDLGDASDMEWIWVRENPNARSRILGRYAYTCFDISGDVDANLLGRAFGEDIPSNGYGAQTNRDNVRKMLLNAVQQSPSMDTSQQYRLAQYQETWGNADTPAALNAWNDRFIGALRMDHLSCYSRAAIHRDGKVPCSVDNIVNNPNFSRLVTDMGGNASDVRKALEDYFDPSPVPQGTDYPSVKAVPMFNEIQAEVRLVQEKASGKWQLKVVLKPEFWCPFPSQDTPQNEYILQPPAVGGGAAQSGSADVWVRLLGSTSGGVFQPTLSLKDVTPTQLSVFPTTYPSSPGEFVYTLDIGGVPMAGDGTPLDIKRLQVASVTFQTPWQLTLDGHAVDSIHEFAMAVSPNLLTSGSGGNTTGTGYLEVDDPRLNHLAARWSASADGTMGKKNSCLNAAQSAAKSYEPGNYMYCRNGKMLSPAELGYIPIYNGSTPWMTLDIFSENGISLMNTLVCNEDTWKTLDQYGVFYTNGTINPYTRDTAVLNGAFYGLDIREVPNMAGLPNSSTEVIGSNLARELSAQLVKATDSSGNTFDKDGPAGWTRVLRDKRIDLNKNERTALAHNTWGLFDESDGLFLVFVVAQSIAEADGTDDPVGYWNAEKDGITGERRAVALCWMDTSAEARANPLARKMEIIAFQYLDE